MTIALIGEGKSNREFDDYKEKVNNENDNNDMIVKTLTSHLTTFEGINKNEQRKEHRWNLTENQNPETNHTISIRFHVDV